MRGTIRSAVVVMVVVALVYTLWPTVEMADGPNGEECFALKNNSTFTGKLICQGEDGQFYEHNTGGK